MASDRRRASARDAPDRGAAGAEAGLGLVAVSVSLLIVAAVAVVAMKTLSGGSGGPSGQSLGSDVSNAYAVQAQSNLSNAMARIQDVAVSDGGFSGLDLTQFGVETGPATAGQVSGVVSSGASAPLGEPGGAGGGSVTLAARAAPDTCWYVWFSSSATWYGVEPGASSCAARPMAQPPTAGAPAPGSVGWQQGGFPGA